jgi:hypothetical protein
MARAPTVDAEIGCDAARRQEEDQAVAKVQADSEVGTRAQVPRGGELESRECSI